MLRFNLIIQANVPNLYSWRSLVTHVHITSRVANQKYIPMMIIVTTITPTSTPTTIPTTTPVESPSSSSDDSSVPDGIARRLHDGVIRVWSFLAVILQLPTTLGKLPQIEFQVCICSFIHFSMVGVCLSTNIICPTTGKTAKNVGISHNNSYRPEKVHFFKEAFLYYYNAILHSYFLNIMVMLVLVRYYEVFVAILNVL